MSEISKEKEQRRKQLALGLLFGLLFGFFLQKGGVGKYHVLIGQLLLEDFTVVKIMLTAILTGMIGAFWMVRKGWVELHIKPTRIAANSVGGLIFGAGFALSAYCPGTNAAALGQGNFDALLVAFGMIAGSYLYAEWNPGFKKGFFSRGDLGKVTLPEMMKVGRWPFIAVFAVLLAVILGAVDHFAVR